jgi:hypothetical protein
MVGPNISTFNEFNQKIFSMKVNNVDFCVLQTLGSIKSDKFTIKTKFSLYITSFTGFSDVFLKRENLVACMGAKKGTYIEKFATPRKGVYFLLPRDHGKGDLIAIWEQFSPHGSISDNPSHLSIDR